MSTAEDKPSIAAVPAISGTRPAALTRVPSFYQPVDETRRESLYGDYVGFLERRNGEMDFAQRRYSKREAHLARLASSGAHFDGHFDLELFRSQYARYDRSRETDSAMQLLLLFCKVNAGEAFGVEVMREARKAYFERSCAQYQAEKIIANEEEYHTKFLLGATQYFGVNMEQAFAPPLPLRIFIHGLAKMPQRFFHSVLLAAEFSGIYLFNTLLHVTRRVMRDQPEVRDAMEERLCAVLVDEVGHVTYNRLALGSGGLRVARWLYPLVQKSVASQPEFLALRQFADDAPSVAEMDYRHLPEEVRRQAFFI
jgi:hypothetical protein